MNFLLDENISQSLYNFLISQGFTVFRVGIHTARGITDEEVIKEAVYKKAVIITRDCSDFGRIIYRKNIKPPGVVCIKGFIGKEEVEIFKELFQQRVSFLKNFTVVERVKGRKRIRQKPI